jgi:hypothetical protein
LANASGPQGYQSTGLWAWSSKYGLVSLASRLAGCFGSGPAAAEAAIETVSTTTSRAAEGDRCIAVSFASGGAIAGLGRLAEPTLRAS